MTLVNYTCVCDRFIMPGAQKSISFAFRALNITLREPKVDTGIMLQSGASESGTMSQENNCLSPLLTTG